MIILRFIWKELSNTIYDWREVWRYAVDANYKVQFRSRWNKWGNEDKS